MKGRIISLCALAALATGANAANFIVNGSFEDLPAGGFNHGSWGLWDKIPGWYAEKYGDDKYNPIEVGLGSVYGVTGYDGNNILELDSTGNSKVSQDVHGLHKDDSYILSFSYAKRAGTTPETNEFNVYWDGHLLDSITPTSTAMTDISFVVKAHKENKLSFLATGTNDSLGGEIDKVGMQCVPEPTSIGAVALGLIGMLRRRFNAN